MILSLIILGLCILLEGFFSGSEIALLAADKMKLRIRVEQMGSRGQALRDFLDDPTELIFTALLGTNICVVLSTVIATLILLRYDPWLAEILSLAVMAPLVLVFGEIIPKSIFQSYADQLAYRTIPWLRFFRLLVYPLVGAGSMISNIVLRWIKLDRPLKSVLSREELSLLLKLPSQEGTNKITAEERHMVKRIFEFSETTVFDVMIPLSEVTALPVTSSLEEVVREIADKQHTRLPLYEERIDQIVGIIHAFDVLRIRALEGLHFEVVNISRPAIFVPENQPAVNTLRQLQREGQGMAIVVDEYGGATGIVTIEDILEEIVGEIEDEYDVEEQSLIAREPAGTYRINGKAPVARVNEKLKITLPIGEEYESIAGLVLDCLKRIPKEGEELFVDNYTVLVTKATDRFVEEIRLRVGRKKGGW